MSTNKNSKESGEPSDQTCPVCGQEYSHKRKQMKSTGKTQLRSDYVECKKPVLARSVDYEVYVHNTQRTVVNRLERGEADQSSLLDKILGWDK